MIRLRSQRRTAIVVVFVFGVAAIGTGIAIWWWRSMGYVSTDDARIQAEMVAISAEISGKIDEITKAEGDSVRSGEVMARLETREVEIQIERARADVDRARSKLLQASREVDLQVERQKSEVPGAQAVLGSHRYNLEDAQAHAKSARQDWLRTKELFDRSLIAAQELAHAETELRQAEAKVSSLREKIKEGEADLQLARVKEREVGIKEADLKAWEAEVRRTEANLSDLRRQLELTRIVSPVNGVVAKKSAHQGEVVQPGQPIFTVVDSSRFWVEANIPETEIRFVKPGNRVTVRVDSYPSRDFQGKVLSIGEATVSEFSLFSPTKLTGTFIKSTQRIPVKITVENRDGRLKVGMLAVVWIERGE